MLKLLFAVVCGAVLLVAAAEEAGADAANLKSKLRARKDRSLKPVSDGTNYYGLNVCHSNKNNAGIPPACQGHYGMTEAQCSAAQSLWATKFNYCCPDFATDFLTMPVGGWKINDPGALGSFNPTCLSGLVKARSPVNVLPLTGLSNGLKWVGDGCGKTERERLATGGCKGFWDCASMSGCQTTCVATPGCLWEKNVCVQDPQLIAKFAECCTADDCSLGSIQG